jgi:hypothetical protein
MCPGPTAECVAGAAALLSGAGFGDVAPDDLQRVALHPAYKKFEQIFHCRLDNGQTDHTIELDLDAHYRLAGLAIEACSRVI